MSRCIDADALEELFREVIGGIAKKPEMNGNLEHMVRASAMVIEMIQDAPTIEPERPKSKWVDSWRSKMDGTRYWYRECDHCGYERKDCDPEKDSNFCPDCGARMEDNNASD